MTAGHFEPTGGSCNIGPCWAAADRPAIRIYPTLVIRPGESVGVRVEGDMPWCGWAGDGGPCRRVLVEASPGEPVELEIVPDDSGKPMALSLEYPFLEPRYVRAPSDGASRRLPIRFRCRHREADGTPLSEGTGAATVRPSLRTRDSVVKSAASGALPRIPIDAPREANSAHAPRDRVALQLRNGRKEKLKVQSLEGQNLVATTGQRYSRGDIVELKTQVHEPHQDDAVDRRSRDGSILRRAPGRFCR